MEMDKTLTIKQIIQYLNDRGLKEVSSKLESESHISLESKEIKEIKNYLVENNLEGAIKLLNSQNGNKFDEISKKETNYIREKFLIKNRILIHIIFEFLNNGEVIKAMELIRNQVTEIMNLANEETILNSSIQQEAEIFKQCAQLLFIKDKVKLTEKMKEICKEALLKENIISYIDALVLMKETNYGNKNLSNIIDNVLKNQIKFCKYHNSKENNFSYFFDHICKKENIPYKCLSTIEQFNEEIINVVFSNLQKHFAVILKSNNIVIYKINKYKKRKQSSEISYIGSIHDNKYTIEICLLNTITNPHKNQITSLQWDHKDSLILTASKDKTIKCFDPYTGSCKMTIEGHDGMVSSAVFVLNDSKILSSGLDYKISLWTMDSVCEYSINVPNVTISELLYSSLLNIVIVIAATTNSILFYDIITKEEIDKIPINDVIISCAISKLDNGGYLLVNSSKATPALFLLNLKSKVFQRKYFGHRQERFVNKCNFGGENENFLTCGSDDATVYVWNRNHSIPIFYLKAHSNAVNAIIWSHTYFTDIIISCSEDHTIKILGNDNIEKVYLVSAENEPNKLKNLGNISIHIDNIITNSNHNNASNLNNVTTNIRSMLSRVGNLLVNPFIDINNDPDNNSDDEER
jgi:WD40 repeat protein